MTLSCSIFRALSVLTLAPLVLAAAERPRLAVLSDIGGDPDDQQTTIRLMHYANEFRAGVAHRDAIRTRNAPSGPTTRPDLIRQIVTPMARRCRTCVGTRAAGRSRLVASAYPVGHPRYGREQIGDGHDTEASRALIARIDAGTPARPLNITIWGGQTTWHRRCGG